jgi:hypothetical protein
MNNEKIEESDGADDDMYTSMSNYYLYDFLIKNIDNKIN